MHTIKLFARILNLQPFGGTETMKFFILFCDWFKSQVENKILHSQLFCLIWSVFPRWKPMVQNREFGTLRIRFIFIKNCFFLILNDEDRRKQKHITELLYSLIVQQVVCFYQTSSSTTTIRAKRKKKKKWKTSVGSRYSVLLQYLLICFHLRFKRSSFVSTVHDSYIAGYQCYRLPVFQTYRLRTENCVFFIHISNLCCLFVAVVKLLSTLISYFQLFTLFTTTVCLR